MNLANVVSIQFWEEGEYRRPYAAIVTTGIIVPNHEGDPTIPHTITVQDEGPIAALRAELQRTGTLPPEADPFPMNYSAREDEPRHANPDTAESARDSAIVNASMPASGPKFDRGRPQRGYNNPK